MNPIRDLEVTAYVDRVGQALASQQAAPYTFTFTLVRGDDTDPWLDPVALPGGWIFIDARSLATFENEAQLAGMLAHAIAHRGAPWYPPVDTGATATGHTWPRTAGGGSGALDLRPRLRTRGRL